MKYTIESGCMHVISTDLNVDLNKKIIIHGDVNKKIVSTLRVERISTVSAGTTKIKAAPTHI